MRWDWRRYQVDVPEGERGAARVERVTVSEADAKFSALRAVIKRSGRAVPAGVHTQLTINGSLWMSDTRAEIRDHQRLFWKVSRWPGCSVLITGLGLGMALNGCLLDGAGKVTCIERDADVIALVGAHWQARWGDKFEVIQADAMELRPRRGQRWDIVWHDIWSSICEDNLDDMRVMKRRFARRCRWQACWSEELLRSWEED